MMKGTYKTMIAASLLLLTAFAAFSCILCEDAEAQPGTEFVDNGLKYKVNTDGKTVTLVGYEGDAPQSLNIDSVTYNEDVYKITIIGPGAFQNCGVSIVVFSNNVKNIAEQAFKGCGSITKVDISPSVKSIGSKAFSSCTSIIDVILPSSIESIAIDAFEGCTFYDTDGETKITDVALIKGYKYHGSSPSKLVKLKEHYVNYDEDGGSEHVEGFWKGEYEIFRVADYYGTKLGFVFGGWNDGQHTYTKGMSYSMGTSNVTLKAVWNPIPTHVISFDINGGTGSVPESVIKEEGESIVLPSCHATKAGCDFGGWSDGRGTYKAGTTYTVKTSDVTFRAVWNTKPVRSVTYDLNGGTGTVPAQAKVTEGTMIKIASCDATKEGGVFGGWSDGTDIWSPGDVYTVNNSVKFSAVWDITPTHLVIYDVGDAEPKKKSQIVDENSKFYLESYDGSKEGYMFKGWSDGNFIFQPGDVYTMKDKDLKFTAVWVAKEKSLDMSSLLYIVLGAIILIGVLFVVLRVLPRRL